VFGLNPGMTSPAKPTSTQMGCASINFLTAFLLASSIIPRFGAISFHLLIISGLFCAGGFQLRFIPFSPLKISKP
jgi:hypothetical protein